MRRHKLLTVLLLIAVAAFAVGCRTSPVYNVAASPVQTANKTPTQADVRSAIMRAGTALRWRVADAGPGKLTATLYQRQHVAIVEISYDTKSYSIDYKDSTELMYDGQNIHNHYNNWIRNLDRRIAMELMSL